MTISRKDRPSDGFFNYRDSPLKTYIYIDGFNLYYGLLRKTSYKWLNIESLFSSIVKIQNPLSEVTRIKYFTAPVKTNFSKHKEKAQQSQNHYHRALNAAISHLEIIGGYFDVDTSTPVVYAEPPDLDNRVETWKLEEKQTDVNIALAMYRDASRGEVEQQILVSSDSDLEPALELIKKDFNSIELGLILPRRRNNKRKNHKLSVHVNWTRHHILTVELEEHQFPEKVPTKKKPVLKPKYW